MGGGERGAGGMVGAASVACPVIKSSAEWNQQEEKMCCCEVSKLQRSGLSDCEAVEDEGEECEKEGFKPGDRSSCLLLFPCDVLCAFLLS